MKNAANNGSDKISHTQCTCGDEELASVIIELCVLCEKGPGLGSCGDLFNCPDVKHGQLRRKTPASVFSEPQTSVKSSEESR